MVPLPAVRSHSVVALAGGVVHAIAVFVWAFTNGVSYAATDPFSIAFALGYGAIGMVAFAAVPLFLLSHYSLVTPALLAAWTLADTVYQWLHVSHPHPLSSYLTVWPLLVGVVILAGIVEASLRTVIDRAFGYTGLGPLWESSEAQH